MLRQTNQRTVFGMRAHARTHTLPWGPHCFPFLHNSVLKPADRSKEGVHIRRRWGARSTLGRERGCPL